MTFTDRNYLAPEWSEWTGWTGCTKACDGGQVTRSRTCKDGKRGEKGCIGPEREIGSQACNRHECGMS